VNPHPEYSIEINSNCPDIYDVEIPKILQAYLSIGAKICSLPAIDRQFKTIDFLIISNIGDWGLGMADLA
jgi:putative hemolysin